MLITARHGHARDQAHSFRVTKGNATAANYCGHNPHSCKFIFSLPHQKLLPLSYVNLYTQCIKAKPFAFWSSFQFSSSFELDNSNLHDLEIITGKHHKFTLYKNSTVLLSYMERKKKGTCCSFGCKYFHKEIVL